MPPLRGAGGGAVTAGPGAGPRYPGPGRCPPHGPKATLASPTTWVLGTVTHASSLMAHRGWGDSSLPCMEGETKALLADGWPWLHAWNGVEVRFKGRSSLAGLQPSLSTRSLSLSQGLPGLQGPSQGLFRGLPHLPQHRPINER